MAIWMPQLKLHVTGTITYMCTYCTFCFDVYAAGFTAVKVVGWTWEASHHPTLSLNPNLKEFPQMLTVGQCVSL